MWECRKVRLIYGMKLWGMKGCDNRGGVVGSPSSLGFDKFRGLERLRGFSSELLVA